MRNKRHIVFIFFSIIFLIFILNTKSNATLNITSTQKGKDPVQLSITSDNSIKKIYIYKRNSNNRYTLLLIQNGNNKTSLQTQISNNHLSSSDTTSFKAIAIYSNATETQMFNIEKVVDYRTPISSQPIPTQAIAQTPTPVRSGMTTVRPTIKRTPTPTHSTSPSQPTTSGKTYYVATNGNNSNPGTEAKPFKTIQYGINKLTAGDTLIIKSGTYTEKIDISKSGSNNKLITIKNSGNVTIDGNNKGGVLMNFKNSAKYISVSGLKFKNLNGKDAKAINFSPSSNNITIINCNFTNIRCPKWNNPGENDTANAIYFEGSGNSSEKAIHHITIKNCVLNNVCAGYSEGISIDCNCNNITIDNVNCSSTSGQKTNIAICVCGNDKETNSNESLNRPDSVTIKNCTISNVYAAYDGGCAYGIYVDGATNVRIENNTVNNSYGGIEVGAEQKNSKHKDRETAVVDIYGNNVNNCRIGMYIGSDSENSHTGTAKTVKLYGNSILNSGKKGEPPIQLDKVNGVTIGGTKDYKTLKGTPHTQKNTIQKNSSGSWYEKTKASKNVSASKSNNIIK